MSALYTIGEKLVWLTVDDRLVKDRDRPSTFTPYSHLTWISTKRSDVLLNPLQPESLIAKTKIGSPISSELFSSKEAEAVQTGAVSDRAVLTGRMVFTGSSQPHILLVCPG